MTNQETSLGINTFCALVETLSRTNSGGELIKHVNRLSTKEKWAVMAYCGVGDTARLVRHIRNHVENYLAK